ncbi:MAG TPA: DUF393 domain-containing protein [Candidatus Deferrimicrobiaceae bacterium]
MAASPLPGPAILIYDGECSVCRRAVEWIRSRALPESLEFLSLHSEELTRRFPSLDPAECRRAAHLVLPGGSVLAGERAAPEVFDRLPGYRWAAVCLRLPGARLLSGIAYRFLAGRRHAIAWLFDPGTGRP